MQRRSQREDKRIAFETDGFSVVVVRHPGTGRWLAVNESKNRGWWLPAGHVDRGQTFIDAAHAETLEEAGIRVVLKGILAIEHTLTSPERARMRVIFYAEPLDPSQPPKSVADSESMGAAWMTVEDLRAKSGIRPPEGLRGKELLNWAMHIEAGGPIAPIEVLQQEEDGPAEALRRLSGAAQQPASAALCNEAGAASPAQLAGAIQSGELERVRQALLSGVDVTASVNVKQWNALHLAAAEDHIETARLLLLAGAPADSRTHKGRTPLHFAVNRRSMGMVRCLLLAGADPAAVDIDGHSCLDTCPPDAPDILEALRR